MSDSQTKVVKEKIVLDIENWSIDVEDGVRSAKLAIEVMIEDANPLVLVNLIRQQIGVLPAQVLGIMHHLAERIIRSEADALLAIEHI